GHGLRRGLSGVLSVVRAARRRARVRAWTWRLDAPRVAGSCLRDVAHRRHAQANRAELATRPRDRRAHRPGTPPPTDVALHRGRLGSALALVGDRGHLLALGDTPSGRLYKALVAKDLATSVFGFPMTQFEPGLALFGAELEASMNQEASMKVMTDTLESIKDHPFTEEELKRAKDALLNAWDRAYSDPETVGIQLSEAIASGDWRLLFLERDQVRKATLASVQQAAERYLLRSNRTSGMYIPTDKPVRAPAFKAVDFDALFKDYKGDGEFTAAESFDTSAANIDARTSRSTLDLPNGRVELALLNKPTRGNRTTATLEIQTGNEKNLQGQSSAADALGELVLRGTPTMTRQQIQDKFQALNASVDVDSRAGQLNIHISTTEKNLPDTVSTVLD
ncbi:MAG: insulinase family protein, partial [Comamonadaceae bacterium]